MKTMKISWEKCKWDELKNYKDTYFYAVTQGRELIYVGSSMAVNGVYKEVHHNRDQFRWNRHKITIWLGYVVDYDGRCTKSLIRNVEKMLIYSNQPRDNIHYKYNDPEINNIKVISEGCPYIKKFIGGLRSKNSQQNGQEQKVSMVIWNTNKGGKLTLYDRLLDYIRHLGDDIEEVEQEIRIAFSSQSRLKGNKMRLVWICKPDYSGTTDFFWVWVRKDTESTPYPEIIKTITHYVDDGGFGYPAFKVGSENDLHKAKEVIRFAYERL